MANLPSPPENTFSGQSPGLVSVPLPSGFLPAVRSLLRHGFRLTEVGGSVHIEERRLFLAYARVVESMLDGLPSEEISKLERGEQ